MAKRLKNKSMGPKSSTVNSAWQTLTTSEGEATLYVRVFTQHFVSSQGKESIQLLVVVKELDGKILETREFYIPLARE